MDVQTGGRQQLKSNVIDVTLILLGALLLPIYFIIFQYDEFIFNMLQCSHVMIVSLYAVLYVTYIKKECFGANEIRYRAFNIVFVYTMFVFFFMFLMYIVRIFTSRK
jgi:hypothetical protein